MMNTPLHHVELGHGVVQLMNTGADGQQNHEAKPTNATPVARLRNKALFYPGARIVKMC